jgi:hypothetical protein
MVYRIYGGGGLGDTWASVSFLGKTPMSKSISVFAKDNANRSEMLPQVISLLGVGDRVKPVNFPGDTFLSHLVWTTPYLSTVKRWVPQKSKRVCYQLEGISNAHRKQPPQQDLERLVSFLPGYEFVRVGKPKSLLESVDLMHNCELFFGICSGFSHVAHSLGIPTFLVQYEMSIGSWHFGKKYTHCIGTDDLIRQVKGYLRV